jgi:hypothetical protein
MKSERTRKRRVGIDAETERMIWEMCQATGKPFNHIVTRALATYRAHLEERERKVASKMRMVLSLDTGLRIFLDDRDKPWIAFDNKTPERVTFTRALNTFAMQWGKHTDGHFGEDEVFSKFFRLIANELHVV